MAIPASAPVGRVLEDVGFEEMLGITVVVAGDDVRSVENGSPVAVMGLRREMVLVPLLEGRVLPSEEADEEMATSVDFGPRPAVLD